MLRYVLFVAFCIYHEPVSLWPLFWWLRYSWLILFCFFILCMGSLLSLAYIRTEDREWELKSPVLVNRLQVKERNKVRCLLLLEHKFCSCCPCSSLYFSLSLSLGSFFSSYIILLFYIYDSVLCLYMLLYICSLMRKLLSASNVAHNFKAQHREKRNQHTPT